MFDRKRLREMIGRYLPKSLVSKSQPAKFVLLVKALLQAEGKPIESASIPELARRFGVSQFSLRKGLNEISGI